MKAKNAAMTKDKVFVVVYGKLGEGINLHSIFKNKEDAYACVRLGQKPEDGDIWFVIEKAIN